MSVSDTQTGSQRIADAFAGNGKRAALMPYMMGGFPSAADTLSIARACVDGGADLIEYGLPFSDPLADGPVIHDAATRALADGAATDSLISEIAPVAAELPVLAMTYYNIVEVRGVARFAQQAAAAGICGLIVPDLPFDEADELLEQCDARGLALVQLVAPTTTEERLREICRRARGFIYTVAYTGTTGTGRAIGDELTELVASVRAHTDLPVAVGFGITEPGDAVAVSEFADGAIVGTRLVRAAAEAQDGGRDPAAAVGGLVAEFAGALG